MPKRQKYTFSCGAASLINAAYHLGAVGQQANDNLEERAYFITSGAQSNQYSLPSRMIDACHYLQRSLGIRISEVRLQGMVFPPKLKQAYAQELNKVRGAQVPIREQKTRRSGHLSLGGGVELFVVMNGLNPNSLHWLAHVGHNRYIDPADGRYHHWWASAYTWKSKYIDTGISLMVQRGAQLYAANRRPNANRAPQHTRAQGGGGWV